MFQKFIADEMVKHGRTLHHDYRSEQWEAKELLSRYALYLLDPTTLTEDLLSAAYDQWRQTHQAEDAR